MKLFDDANDIIFVRNIEKFTCYKFTSILLFINWQVVALVYSPLSFRMMLIDTDLCIEVPV